jgi:hypothetical protein
MAGTLEDQESERLAHRTQAGRSVKKRVSVAGIAAGNQAA